MSLGLPNHCSYFIYCSGVPDRGSLLCASTYLSREFDNTVIFPSDGSGKFNPTSLHCGLLYEVQGSNPNPLPHTHFSGHLTSLSPYGSFSSGRCPQSNPVPHPPLSSPYCQRRMIKKSNVVANFSTRDPQKPSSSKANRMMYNVVTQVIISLDNSHSECNVKSASDKVQKQVGFSVALLDLLQIMSLHWEWSFGNPPRKLLQHPMPLMKS